MEVGDPSLDEVVCGPVIDAKNADRVQSWVKEAVDGGARMVCGGEREQNLVQPVFLENVESSAKVKCAEVFGPVVVLDRYSTESEAIDRVNDSVFGLQTGVFTDRLSFLWRCYEELEVGGVIHNDFPTFRVDHMPYGGVKESGLGREGISYAMEDYTERRILALRPGGPPR